MPKTSHRAPRAHRTYRTRAFAALAVAGIVAGTAGAAHADTIYNNLDASVDAVAEAMPLNVGGATGTTTLAVVTTNNDGKKGCNLTGSTTLTVAIASSNPAVATVSPASVTFTSCGDTKALTVTPVAAGSTTVTATTTSNTTAGSFDTAPATFTVTVAGPANTAPTVTVSGVDEGGSYPEGSVPAATCVAADKEDGNSTFAATLSALTGPYASAGVGSQTASCSYTDAGGLTASASKTYAVVDGTAPEITYTLDPASPDGSDGWYRGDVSLVWHVSDPESPTSVVLTGCANQSVTADQAATEYSCAATSAGGSAGAVKVTVKRDATAPVVSGSVTSTPILVDGATWYADGADVEFAATDATSGVALGSPTPPSSTLGEGFDQTATASALDVAGNTGTGSVTGINVDASAPAVSAQLTDAPAWGAWYKDSATVTVSASDPDLSDGHAGSGIATASTGGTFTTSGSYTAEATDNVGHTSTADTVSYLVDASDPTVDLVCPSGNVLKGSTASAGWTASDEGSGLAGSASGSVPLDTSTVGTRTATAPTVYDHVGHASAATTCGYSVVYDWSGFFQPIDNNGVYNVVKAGSAVPVKFSLHGDQGLGIFAAGYPTTKVVTCPAAAPTDVLEALATSTTSGLKYDATADQYNYTWKTTSTLAGTCQQLTVKLVDGTSHTALFKFTK